jgi:hypothetical protein
MHVCAGTDRLVAALGVSVAEQRLVCGAAVGHGAPHARRLALTRAAPAAPGQVGQRKQRQRDPARERGLESGEPRFLKRVHGPVQAIAVQLEQHCAATRSVSHYAHACQRGALT